MLLVTGPTGHVGRELVRRLLNQKQEFRVMCRHAERGKALVAEGLDVVMGDFDHPDSIVSALEGVKRVVLISPLHPEMVGHRHRLLEAAGRAGVEHVVDLSAYGAHLDSPARVLRAHAEVEHDLRESGLGWTILRPHYLMQNLLVYRPVINEEGSLYAPMGNGRISIVDARDVAAAAAEVLAHDHHRGAEYELTGPEALSFAEMAAKLSAVLRRRVAYVDQRPEQTRRDMLAAGTPEWLADAILELYEIYREDLATAVTDAVEKITGERPRGFDEFAVDHAHLFEKKKRERPGE